MPSSSADSRTGAAERESPRAQLLVTTSLVDTARSKLDEALRAEGEALASACEAVETSGAASVDAARALRSAQTAHARSSAAACELRALNAQVDRDHARADAPAASSVRPRNDVP